MLLPLLSCKLCHLFKNVGIHLTFPMFADASECTSHGTYLAIRVALDVLALNSKCVLVWSTCRRCIRRGRRGCGRQSDACWPCVFWPGELGLE